MTHGSSSPAAQAEFEEKVDKNDKEQMSLLEEMRRHVKKLEDLRKHEDPRLSFSTPEFREAQRIFTDNFKKNFGKPVEWAFVKKHAWSKPQLVKLDKPVSGLPSPRRATWAEGARADNLSLFPSSLPSRRTTTRSTSMATLGPSTRRESRFSRLEEDHPPISRGTRTKR